MNQIKNADIILSGLNMVNASTQVVNFAKIDIHHEENSPSFWKLVGLSILFLLGAAFAGPWIFSLIATVVLFIPNLMILALVKNTISRLFLIFLTLGAFIWLYCYGIIYGIINELGTSSVWVGIVGCLCCVKSCSVPSCGRSFVSVSNDVIEEEHKNLAMSFAFISSISIVLQYHYPSQSSIFWAYLILALMLSLIVFRLKSFLDN